MTKITTEQATAETWTEADHRPEPQVGLDALAYLTGYAAGAATVRTLVELGTSQAERNELASRWYARHAGPLPYAKLRWPSDEKARKGFITGFLSELRGARLEIQLPS